MRGHRGQAFVEYLLFIALAVGVVVGVLYPLFERNMVRYQERILSSGQSVVSQQRMGIPFEWFFGSGLSADDINARLAAAGDSVQTPIDSTGGPSSAGGPGANPEGAGGGDGGEGEGDGAGGPGGGGGRGPGRRSSGGGAGGGASGSGGDGDPASDQGPGAAGARAKSAQAGDPSGGSGSADRDRAGQDPSLAGGETASEGAEGGDEASRKGRRFEEQTRVAQGGCRSMDFFTLFKLIAVIAILLLLGGIALTNRGNRKK